MPIQQTPPLEDAFLTQFIRRKVNRLIGCAGITPQDCEELSCDLYLHALQRLPQYNPQRGTRHGFAATVVLRRLSSILRDRQAGKRNERGLLSLNVSITDGEGGATELAQSIGERELDRRLSRERRLSDEELKSLAIDLERVAASLPENLRTLLERRKTQTIAEISRELGIPRTTLNDWMQSIRRRFEAAGLRGYWED